MVLIGIVMSMGLKMVTSTLENAAYSETKSKQERVKIALISYLRTNGVLPCPDNTAGVATGAAAVSCNANAADGYGVVPWQTLGLSRESVIDGWGNYFTYRVATGNPGGKNWTAKLASGTDLTINEIKTPTDALTIQGLDSAGTGLVNVTTKGVVTIVSHGKNAFGAKTTKVAGRISSAGIGAGETTNATANTSTFVFRPVNEATGAFNGPYDDLLAYMTPEDLLQPLISEGSLKACVAYCSPATSTCPVPTETCSCPNGAGIPGTPGTCSAICNICMTQPAVPPCPSTSPIPVGVPTVICS